MLEVYSVETDTDISNEAFFNLLNLVASEKRRRIERLSNRRDAVNMLIGDIIARKAICRRTGLTNKSLVFRLNQYGKPFLENGTDIYFNISHSGNFAVCALNSETVGIDIEIIKKANLKVAKRFFCPDEHEFITKANKINEAFYKIWTMKESFVKWEGKGLSTPLDSFSVLEIERRGRPYFHAVNVPGEVYCSVCTDTELINPCIHGKLSDLLISGYFSELF